MLVHSIRGDNAGDSTGVVIWLKEVNTTTKVRKGTSNKVFIVNKDLVK